MCEDCFESEHKGFSTQTDFEIFEKELDKNVSSCKLPLVRTA